MASTPNNIKRLSGHLLRQGDYLYSRTGKKVSGTGTINQHGSIEECLSLYKKELLNPNGMRFTSIVPIHEDQSTVIDAALWNSAQNLERSGMRVEQHFMRLRVIRHHDKRPAGRQLDMRHLQATT